METVFLSQCNSASKQAVWKWTPAVEQSLPKRRKRFLQNSEKFIDNVLKGVYIKTDYGDGTILYVDRVDLQMQFRFHYVDSLGVKLTKKTVKTLYIIVRQQCLPPPKKLFKPISLKAPRN